MMKEAPESMKISGKYRMLAAAIILSLAAIFYVKNKTVTKIPKLENNLKYPSMILGKLSAKEIRTRGSQDRYFQIHNFSDDVLDIKNFHVSCPCILVLPKQIIIEPNQSKPIALSYNLDEDPSFVGNLSVNLDGIDFDARIVFSTRVEIEITP